MLDRLEKVMQVLPSLLVDEDRWTGLKVTYHPPEVHRLWMQHGDDRISLHEIFPCDEGKALFHKHKWPSAMAILAGGKYKMRLGHSLLPLADVAPEDVVTVVLSSGSSYEMTDPNACHSVQPLERSVLTVMLSGKPWLLAGDDVDKEGRGKSVSMSSDEKYVLLRKFSNLSFLCFRNTY